MTENTQTLDSVENDRIDFATLVRVLVDDVETVASQSDLQTHAPSEGRVAVVTAGSKPYDVFVGTGSSWLDVRAELGLSLAQQELAPQDLTAGDAPAPASAGVQATHDGTGTPPAGTYAADPANNQWVGADDRTSGTTIAY